MDWSPKDVIEWYKKRPPWLKVFLSVVFVVAVVLAAVWWLLGKTTDPRHPTKSEALEGITDALEAKHQREFKVAQEQSKMILKEIADEQTKRLKLKKEREEKAKENEKDHNELDRVAHNADDVVSMLNKQRERRSR